MTDSEVPHIPDMSLADHVFTLTAPNMAYQHELARSALMAAIKEDNMAPLYLYLHENPSTCDKIGWDEELYSQLKATNEADMAKLEEAFTSAQEMNGEHEVTEALCKKAEYLAKIADKENAMAAYQTAFDRTATLGARIDLLFGMIRLGMFFSDWTFVGTTLDRAVVLIEEGGDWDRRNRLRAYRGMYRLYCRDFSNAAVLLLDSMSTFSSTELVSYNDIVKYAVIAGAIALSRVDMKRKIVDSPEVLAILPADSKLASLESCVNSLYLCDYAGFFAALAQVEQEHLKTSRYLAPHTRYYVREMRRRGYAQILESYRALSITSMAAAFGVTPVFLDHDLSTFIPEKKLNCVIDRVNGIIETNRPDEKNRQYQEVVKQGDVLLNKLQKYQAAISSLK